MFSKDKSYINQMHIKKKKKKWGLGFDKKYIIKKYGLFSGDLKRAVKNAINYH